MTRNVDESARSNPRATLRVYIGYARGVGMTSRMVSRALGKSAPRGDATAHRSPLPVPVVGVVDARGDAETGELLSRLERIPRRLVESGGRTYEEFDLEAAIALKPKTLLVDELSHTNAPGCRHAKRWQDVLDLLDAGIDVHTTLNVQHLESLNDAIQQITGVRVSDTVPDSMLERAEEVELVDLPPEELESVADFENTESFPPGEPVNRQPLGRGMLLALRELALRTAADRVGRDVLSHRERQAISATWPTRERIVVCVGPAPASSRLVRAAARMAAPHTPWAAVYVDRTGTGPMNAASRERLESHLRLAERLGGEVVRISGARIAASLLGYARRHNATRIVIGKATHSRLRDVLYGSVLDEVVRGSGDIDVHVISGEELEVAESESSAERKPAPGGRAGYVWAVALVAGATLVASLGRALFALPDIVMLYLLIIMIVALRFSRGASVLAALLSVASYDFFFIPPFFTLSVSDVRHILTFLMMFGVGLITSGLTLQIRRQESEARSREARTAALYALSSELGAAAEPSAVAAAIARHAAEVFECGAAIAVAGESGEPSLVARYGDVRFESEERATAKWVLHHGRPAGRSTETLPQTSAFCVPLSGGRAPLGVLLLSVGAEPAALVRDRHFRDAYIRQGAMALERARLAEDAEAAAIRARTEEMRSALLSAVSHDLRTPLAAITGAGTMLRDDAARVGATERAELIATICEEAERLERLVRNLLDMTRLESGSLTVKREWVPLEELVVSALTRLMGRLDGRPITTDIPRDFPLLSVDPVLFEQVFLNLFENAAKYTPATSAMEIRARRVEKRIEVEVSDHGPGFASGAERRVFERFFRGENARGGGFGLGLPICLGIVEAHGGTLVAENRSGGGALFRITLPVFDDAPVVPIEPDAAEGATS